jgi:uncharacterized DUF497 family protein
LVKIGWLDWRPDRVEHIARHQVRPYEVEEAVFGDRNRILRRVGPARRNPKETVYRYLGRTEAGRYLFGALLVYENREAALPITARDMTDTEKKRYRG